LKPRIVAVGDIHGCFRTFEKLILQLNPAKNDKLILLGDYIDRGPHPKEVLDLILTLIKEGFDIIPLIGNHENMLLESRRNALTFNMWMFNGGEATLKSFGVKSAMDIEEKYINFFNGLRYYYSYQNYLFVHAGFNESNTDIFYDKSAMLWTRKECYQSKFFTDKTLIHGHTPINLNSLEFAVANRSGVINVDTGCVYSFGGVMGVLSAIELPSFKVFTQLNID
jgi:serine/threonine protein phosphatase 1